MNPVVSSINTSAHKKTLISVVIPSRQRPALLVQAVQSVLDQKRDDFEVIVVLDGDTAGSAETLQEHFPEEHRLRVVTIATHQGVSVARNLGVAAALGQWIAFHDDDDQWVPGKLDRQMAVALASQYPEPVVTCQLVVAGKKTIRRQIWPHKAPTRPMCEYLYSRKGFPGEAGVLTPSTVLAPRSLCLRVPSTPGLPKHEDGDWAMLIGEEPTVGFEFIAEPLVIYNCEPDGRDRITGFEDWLFSLGFAKSRRSLLTSRAYAGFVLSRCVGAAASRKCWKAIIPLFVEAFRRGSPTAADILGALEACARSLAKSALSLLQPIEQPVIVPRTAHPE